MADGVVEGAECIGGGLASVTAYLVEQEVLGGAPLLQCRARHLARTCPADGGQVALALDPARMMHDDRETVRGVGDRALQHRERGVLEGVGIGEHDESRLAEQRGAQGLGERLRRRLGHAQRQHRRGFTEALARRSTRVGQGPVDEHLLGADDQREGEAGHGVSMPPGCTNAQAAAMESTVCRRRRSRKTYTCPQWRSSHEKGGEAARALEARSHHRCCSNGAD